MEFSHVAANASDSESLEVAGVTYVRQHVVVAPYVDLEQAILELS